MRIALIVLCILLFCYEGFSQSYSFSRFGEGEGLFSPYVNTIDQDEKGQLILGTSEGIYAFDGKKFTQFPIDTSKSQHIVCSAKGFDGKFWFGLNDGSIAVLENGHIRFPNTPPLLSRITDIAITPDGVVYAASQTGGLLVISGDQQPVIYKKGLEDFVLSSLCIGPNNHIWIGTDFGMYFAEFKPSQAIELLEVKGISQTNITDIVALSNASLLVSTSDAGLLKYSFGDSPTVSELTSQEIDLKSVQIRQVLADANGHIWLSTNNRGLIELYDLRNNVFTRTALYHEDTEIPVTISTSFIDREDLIWCGTVGQGLLALHDEFFSYYHAPDKMLIDHVYKQGSTTLISSIGSIVAVSNDLSKELWRLDRKSGLPDDEIIALTISDDSILWAGTASSGLFMKKSKSSKFTKVNLGEDLLNRRINDLLAVENDVLVATDFGAFRVAANRVSERIGIESGLSGNVIKCFFRDSQKRVWLGATVSEFGYLENGILKKFPSPLPNSTYPVTCFAEDQNNNIWVGTDGAGIMKADPENPFIIQKSDGLFNSFCHSMICNRRNQIWVGHRGGITKYDINRGEINIYYPGSNREADFDEIIIFNGMRGDLLFCSKENITFYNPDKDVVNNKEPALSIKNLMVNDRSYDFNQPLFLDYGDYFIRIEFQGISLQNPGGVFFESMIEGYDNRWNIIKGESEISVNKLPPGEYRIHIRAYNGNNIGGNNEKIIVITIYPPYWMKWWFWSAVVLALSLTGIIAYKQRVRKFTENQMILEAALAERTKEVVQQKELLEIKNRDITDSIIYAKNIQKAMLPPVNSLAGYFNDAFVFYKPRDIVSGDFYWAGKFGNKVVVACADCTGHGVPGAFMSLISGTLIKEVARMKEVTSPADFLQVLDGEIKNLLNRNLNDGIDDGMDIAIIEYDLDTQILRFAGANRPLVMLVDHEIIEVKGDRRAIGGKEDYNKKSFQQHEFKLKKGDCLYMFSDGITDQFGGPKGKKFKRSGLFEIIKNVGDKVMIHQQQAIKNAFSEWKGSLDQIDDVILLGIRI